MSKRRKPTTIRSKWRKTEVLCKNPWLQSFMPETVRFSKARLRRMLDTCPTVYLKPDGGSLGRGVIRLERTYRGQAGNGGYLVRTGAKRRTFRSFYNLYRYVSQYSKRENYLVQRGVRLLRYRNRPADLRIMVQQNPQGQWEMTGMVVRVANPKQIVTNGSRGGTVVPPDPVVVFTLQPCPTNDAEEKIGNHRHDNSPPDGRSLAGHPGNRAGYRVGHRASPLDSGSQYPA